MSDKIVSIVRVVDDKPEDILIYNLRNDACGSTNK